MFFPSVKKEKKELITVIEKHSQPVLWRMYVSITCRRIIRYCQYPEGWLKVVRGEEEVITLAPEKCFQCGVSHLSAIVMVKIGQKN